jgi:nitrogen fixation/metabolism regulation signal transduction histidine kinase
MIATLLSAKAGLAVAPIVIVAVVTAYLVSITLTAFVDNRVGARPARQDQAVPST